MRESKVTLRQQLNYILITVVVGIIGEVVWGIANSLANSLVKEKPSDLIVIIVNILFVLLILISTTIAMSFLTRNHVYEQYYESDDPKSWIYSCFKYCFIGEIVKFIICMIPINTMRFGAYLNRISRILYDAIYLTSRHDYGEFLKGHYVAADFVVYFFVQLLSVIIILPMIALAFRYNWHVTDKEHRELTRYQSRN